MTTLATYVEMPTPRRAVDGGDESLPADLTVAFGAAEAPVAGSVPLHDFLRTAGQLTHAERLLLVEQAMLMLDGNYVHLPLKSAMHAVNPVQRLRLLRARLLRQTAETMDPERIFHAEMSAVFHSVRDLHTNYLLPAPFAGMIAYLPFQVERYSDGADEKFIVTRLAAGMSAPPFAAGVEITHWNGMPITRAVAVNADRFAGSNMAARLARGVDSLTIRSLRLHLPPDEEWVTVSYLDAAGVRRELREPWLVAPNAPAMADTEAVTTAAASMGLDLHADETGRARALLYAPRAVQQTLGNIAVDVSAEPAAAGAEVPSTMPLVFRARSVVTAVGHLRAPADLHVQRPGPGRLRSRVRAPGGAAAAGGADPRRAGQRRRPHLRQRVHPADPDAPADHPGAGAVQLHPAEPGDLPAAQGQPDPPDRPRARGSRRWTRPSRPGRSTRRRSRSPRWTAPTRSASGTSAPSSS